MGNESTTAPSAGGSQPERVGRISKKFVQTDRGIFPWSVLDRYEIEKKAKPAAEKAGGEGGVDEAESKQQLDDRQYYAEHDLLPYPFPVQSFLDLRENCTYFDACVRQIAADVTGQGFKAEAFGEGEGSPAGEPAAPLAEATGEEAAKKIKAFLGRVNPNGETVAEIYKKGVEDWGTVGWWGIEVSRGPDINGKPGQPNGLFHVPAHTLRVKKGGNLYCQNRLPGKYVWFKAFGYPSDVNSETGVEAPLGSLDPSIRAHELLFYKNYFQRSSWYGAPNVLPAVGAVIGILASRDYNLAFFENYGMPVAIVTIEGAWEEGATDRVADFLNVECKGAANAHKTIVLNPPAGGGVKVEPLVADIKEGHFKLYTKQLISEILVSYRMPAYRVGIVETGSLGGNVAEETTPIYIGGVVKPLDTVIEAQVQWLIEEGFGEKRVRFSLNDVDIRDKFRETDRCEKLFGMGVMTRSQVALDLALPAIPKEDKDRDTYYIKAGYVPVAMAGQTPAPGSVAAADLEKEMAGARDLESMAMEMNRLIRLNRATIAAAQEKEES